MKLKLLQLLQSKGFLTKTYVQKQRKIAYRFDYVLSQEYVQICLNQ